MSRGQLLSRLPGLTLLRWFAVVGCALGAFGCTGLLQTGGFRGACHDEQRRCTKRCAALVDGHACLDGCQRQARGCVARQSDKELGFDLDEPKTGAAGALLTLTADFSGGRVRATQPTVAMRGKAVPLGHAYAIAPGASVHLSFPVLPTMTDAELELLHAAEAGCFITVTVGDSPILSRYTAPTQTQDKLVHAERWIVSQPAIAVARRGEALNVFIYNNAEAGSSTAYFLSKVSLTYRAAKGP